jgi:hypothetical protein
MATYRRAHPGAPFGQCRAALIKAGTILEEWGIAEDLWRHYWSRLKNEQP